MCGSIGTQRKVNISFMKVCETRVHCAGRSQTTRLHDGLRRNLGGPRQGSTNPAWRGIGRSKLGDWYGIPKACFYQRSVNSIRKKKQLVALLQRYVDVFTWTYDEMPGLDPGLVVHSFNMDPRVKPVVQPAKIFHTEVKAQITQEVRKLLAAEFIKPIQHPKWLSNIVPMKKKNDQI